MLLGQIFDLSQILLGQFRSQIVLGQMFDGIDLMNKKLICLLFIRFIQSVLNIQLFFRKCNYPDSK